MATKRKSSKGKTNKSVSQSSKVNATKGKVSNSRSIAITEKLRRWNLIIAVVLAIQAILILIVGKASTLPVVSRYLAMDSIASETAGHTVLAPAVKYLFYIDMRYIVIAFLLTSAISYWLVATIRRKNYESDLRNSTNKTRWVNFGLTSGIMLVLIAMLNGIYDIATLLAVFVMVGLLHFLAFFGEAKTSDSKTKMQIFTALCVVGATVWIIIDSYLKGAIFYGNGLSKAVYWIDGIILLITLGLAYNKFRIFKQAGRWSNYYFAEKVFTGLNFTALTALTWLVFAGFLK